MIGLADRAANARQCRLDRHGLNGMDELADDRCVDAQTTKCHTPSQPEHHAPAVASIDRLGGSSRIIHRQTHLLQFARRRGISY